MKESVYFSSFAVTDFLIPKELSPPLASLTFMIGGQSLPPSMKLSQDRWTSNPGSPSYTSSRAHPAQGLCGTLSLEQY